MGSRWWQNGVSYSDHAVKKFTNRPYIYYIYMYIYMFRVASTAASIVKNFTISHSHHPNIVRKVNIRIVIIVKNFTNGVAVGEWCATDTNFA